MISVDISEDMILYAKHNHQSPSVTYAVGNIMDDDFQFRDTKFNKIFAVYVLHFIKDYKEALKRFYDLLIPGGQMGFTVITRSSLFLFHQKISKIPKWSPYLQGYENLIPDWVENHTDAEDCFRSCLTSIGFEIKALSKNTQEFYFPKIDTLIQLFCSVSPYFKSIPLRLQSDFKQELEEFLRQHWNVKIHENSIHKNYEMIYAVVNKLDI